MYGTRKGNKWLTSMLVEAANSAARTKDTYLAAQFSRLASRRGHNRAAVAVAHSMLVSAYWMLVRDEEYKDLGPDWACDLFFASEREYWQRRNRAAHSGAVAQRAR